MLRPEPEEAASLEVEHHLAELAERLAAQGMDAAAARREAERRFGNPVRYRARLARTERRRWTMMRRMAALETLAGGVARAARNLRRHPGFAAGVVLTLALGVGANAAMFGILDRLLFQPPSHVVDHERVARILVERPFMGRDTRQSSIAFPDYLDLKAHAGFAAVAAWSGPGRWTVGRGPDATRARVVQATHELFPLLGARPELGRFYGPAEDRIGAPATAVVGHEYWTRVLGGGADVLGRVLELAGHSYTIVGVAPPGFTGVDLFPVDVWLPLETSQGITAGTEWRDSRDWFWMRTVARLAEGTDRAAAAAEATRLHRNGRGAEIEEGRYPEATVALDPLILGRGPEASAESRVARWLGGVSLVVLLIACANVANLLLARGTRQRREVAVRLALGVDRARLIMQMMVEAVVLAVLGGGIALLLAAWGGAAIRGLLLPGIHFPDSPATLRAVLFTLGAAAAAGLLAGVGPALQSTRVDLTGDLAMGAGAASRRRSRTRALLTVAQAAMSVVLLVGAGLFVRSVAEVRALDLGLDTDRLLLATLEFEAGLVPDADPGAPPSGEETGIRNEIYAEAMARLRTVPRVASVAGTDSPFGWALATALEVPGLDSLPALPGGGPYLQDVTPGYLATVGLRPVRGRDFGPTAVAGSPGVALVSETMARTLWPAADPLGKVLLVDGERVPFTVVGVVEDASRGDLQTDPFMAYYMPRAQRPERRLNALYVRTSGDPEAVAAAVAPVLRATDPRVRFADVRPLRALVDPQARSWTLGAALFTVFGVLALVVAAIGLYSVLAFDVAQRTRELGIRTALGVEKRRLLATVVLDGVRMAALGVLLGLGVAIAAGPAVGGLLFAVSPHDPLVLGLVAGLLVAVSALASLAPALRATRVDPVGALRAE